MALVDRLNGISHHAFGWPTGPVLLRWLKEGLSGTSDDHGIRDRRTGSLEVITNSISIGGNAIVVGVMYSVAVPLPMDEGALDSDVFLTAADAAVLNELRVVRLHYTYAIRDFNTFREDLRYVYLMPDSQTPVVLPLIWRSRVIQANMVVLDGSGRNLVYLPSRAGDNFTATWLDVLWRDFSQSLSPTRQKQFSSLPGIIRALASFELNEGLKRRAVKQVRRLQKIFRNNGKFRHFADFAVKLADSYVPFVYLPDDLRHPRERFLLLHHGVDVYEPAGRRSTLSLLWFLICGRISFEIPLPVVGISSPPWERTDALHVRVLLPSELQIGRRPVLLPSGLAKISDVFRFKTTEENVFYGYIDTESYKKFEQISRRLEQIREKTLRMVLKGATSGGRNLERLVSMLDWSDRSLSDKKSVASAPLDLTVARVLVRFVGLGFRSISGRPRIKVKGEVTPGVRTLIAILWIVVGLSYWWSLTTPFELILQATLLSALLVVILSLSVFSIGRRFLREMVSAHSLCAVIAFVELLILRAAILPG